MENKLQERPKESFPKVRFLDQYMQRHKGFIAGGCFKNIFKGTKIKDLDMFFENETDFNEAVNLFEKDNRYVFSYENPKVKAYKNKETEIRVELIGSVYGTPSEVLGKFDFTITKYAYAKRITEDGIVYYNLFVNTYFEDLTNGKLVIDDQMLFPVSSWERSYRYRSYGFGLCRESKEKLLEALKDAETDDLSNELYFGID